MRYYNKPARSPPKKEIYPKKNFEAKKSAFKPPTLIERFNTPVVEPSLPFQPLPTSFEDKPERFYSPEKAKRYETQGQLATPQQQPPSRSRYAPLSKPVVEKYADSMKEMFGGEKAPVKRFYPQQQPPKKYMPEPRKPTTANNNTPVRPPFRPTNKAPVRQQQYGGGAEARVEPVPAHDNKDHHHHVFEPSQQYKAVDSFEDDQYTAPQTSNDKPEMKKEYNMEPTPMAMKEKYNSMQQGGEVKKEVESEVKQASTKKPYIPEYKYEAKNFRPPLKTPKYSPEDHPVIRYMPPFSFKD